MTDQAPKPLPQPLEPAASDGAGPAIPPGAVPLPPEAEPAPLPPMAALADPPPGVSSPHLRVEATLPPPLVPPDPPPAPPAAVEASPPAPDLPALFPEIPPAPSLPQPSVAPPASWTLPQLNPERATARRLRPGRFAGGMAPALVLAALAPVVALALALGGVLGPAPEVPQELGVDPRLQQDAAALREALVKAQAEAAAIHAPVTSISRVEARRAAYRGAALVESEIRRLQQEALHAAELEAALTRNPSLAQKNKQPPVAPAALEPFLRKVGLTTPAESAEGEVVLDDAGNALGAPVPPGFVAVMQAAATPEANGTAELEGRVAVRAPVQGGSLTVVAVRKLPDVARPQAFDGVEAALDRLTAGTQQLPAALAVVRSQVDAQTFRLRLAAFLALVVAVAGLLLALRQWRVRVVEPLRDVRAHLEQVRAGVASEPTAANVPLSDLHALLEEVAAQLAASRDAQDAARERAAALDSILDACRRAQQGDLTARPAAGPGTEGLAALAVSHLLDTVEQRALRVRTQARALLETLSAAEQMSAPSLQAPAITTPLQTIHKRLESLAPLSGLLRNLAARMQSLSAQGDLKVVAEDLTRLATAVAPRAQAVAALLTDLQDNARKLEEALGSARATPVTEVLARARAAAAEMARDTSAQHMDESFPGLLSALRGVAPPEVEAAWRLALDRNHQPPS